VGASPVIDRLVADKKLDAADLAGQWESFVIQTVQQPLPGVERALVIAGSDRRGTAFGVFEVSEQIGVSPWYFWADVPPTKRDAIAIRAGTYRAAPPTVKYRGIFINDEDWGLQPWAAKTFDPEFKDIGPKTYERVFELLLRLKGNYFWPAMHHCTVEFGAVPDNVKLADEWGIVMGAAHCEPLNRNNVWWPKDGNGEWRYDTNRANMIAYWEEWAKKRGKYEAVWTVGMRGIHDTPMPGPKDMPGKVRLLEQAIADQRDLLKKHVNPKVEQVPQVFTPYKEALAHYQNGLKLPDDVTILWCEDNYGYIRQLSTPEEQKRSGGSGVYYHISYLGWPRPYLWINTTPPALIWSEMTKALDYGADRIWVLNVGDIKPGEIGTEFWLRLAWNAKRYGPDAQNVFLKEWAARDFGADVADEIAAVMNDYYRLGFQRKPELMEDDAFSVVHHGEAQRRLEEHRSMLRRAESIYERLPAAQRDAFYQLVLYPVRVAALVNEAFINADFSRLYARQGRVSANAHADKSEAAVAQIKRETDYFNNELAGGKWRHVMTAKGIGGDWNLKWPAVSRVEPEPEPAMGVVVEGQGVPLLAKDAKPSTRGTMIDLAAAEGKITKPFRVVEHDGVKAVVVPNVESGKSRGNTLEPGAGAKAVYAFNVPRAGKYNLFVQVNCPTNEDDSWFIKLDDGKWQMWNDVGTRSGWAWRKQGEYELAAGKHTLTFASREDGAMFARIRVTDQTSPEKLEELFPGATPDVLPTFNRVAQQKHYIDVYNTSAQPFEFKAVASEPWVKLSQSGGTVDDEARVWIEIDWKQAPVAQRVPATIKMTGPGGERTVRLEVSNPGTNSNDVARFVETSGAVSIEAEHFTKETSDGKTKWTTVASLGRTGDAVSALPADAPSRDDAAAIVKDPVVLEYAFDATTTGAAKVMAYCLPTHRAHEGRGLRYAVSIDDAPPTVMDFYESGGASGENSPRWRDNVTRNVSVNVTTHQIAKPGRHTLKLWMVDPGVVVDKLVIDLGGVKPSELGPPESLSTEAAGAR
jgi:hypothetical protein